MTEELYVRSAKHNNIVQVTHTNIQESEKMAENYAKIAEKSSVISKTCLETMQRLLKEQEEVSIYHTYDDTEIRQEISSISSSIPYKLSDLINDTGYITGISADNVTTALDYTPENQSNKVSSISSANTNDEYPSAKCVYDELTNKANKTLSNVSSTITTIPPKKLYNFDGGFVSSRKFDLFTQTAVNTYAMTLSDITNDDGEPLMPVDNYSYFILLDVRANAGTSTTNCALFINTDYVTDLTAYTIDKGYYFERNVIWVPIGANKKITITLTGVKVNSTRIVFHGYRRIGANS